MPTSKYYRKREKRIREALIESEVHTPDEMRGKHCAVVSPKEDKLITTLMVENYRKSTQNALN